MMTGLHPASLRRACDIHEASPRSRKGKAVSHKRRRMHKTLKDGLKHRPFIESQPQKDRALSGQCASLPSVLLCFLCLLWLKAAGVRKTRNQQTVRLRVSVPPW